ncbi:hypothetical protein P3S67_014564 [Capsicum chacoense]
MRNSMFSFYFGNVMIVIKLSMHYTFVTLNIIFSWSLKVIHMEWGNFRSTHLSVTEYDQNLDGSSLNPEEQVPNSTLKMSKIVLQLSDIINSSETHLSAAWIMGILKILGRDI